jgi:ribonuclease VapC
VIVDSSALISIVRKEPRSSIYQSILLDSPTNRISAANLLEAAIVVDRFADTEAGRSLDELIPYLRIMTEPVTSAQVSIARQAYQRFGRGSGHPAKLNFGDCFAYALAKALDEPLLFIGNDFIHTDIRRVLD